MLEKVATTRLPFERILRRSAFGLSEESILPLVEVENDVENEPQAFCVNKLDSGSRRTVRAAHSSPPIPPSYRAGTDRERSACACRSPSSPHLYLWSSRSTLSASPGTVRP